MQKILVVEDEPAIGELIASTLEGADFLVCHVLGVYEATTSIIEDKPDLIVLDWMLSRGESGLDLVNRLKKDDTTKDIPIIMLTAKGEEDNKVRGLEAGVDDYITKPFSTRELVSRVKAVLRRTHGIKPVVCAGRLCINTASQRIMVGEEEVMMSSTEYRLLLFFMTHPDSFYSRTQLLDGVWGSNVYIDERTIDVHIRRLRKVLSPFGVDGFVQTVRGFGYRFCGDNK